MTKKEYILKMLDWLNDSWPLAQGLKLLIQSNSFDDDMLTVFQQMFADAIKMTNNQEAQVKLTQAQVFLKKLQAAELEEMKKDQKDIADLEAMLQ